MDKLFKLYKGEPIVVYAETSEKAIQIAKQELNLHNDHIIIESLLSEIRSEDDIPKSKKNVIPYGTYNEDEKGTVTQILKRINKNKPKLKFEYCECGCHGSSCEIAGMEYSLLGVYDDKKHDIVDWILYNGHASCLSEIIGHYKTFEQGALVAELLVRNRLKDIADKLNLNIIEK